MSTRSAILSVFLIEAALGALAVLNHGWEISALQGVTRYSGRYSLLIFSLIFLFHKSSAIPISRILSDRFFLTFAVAHGIHLIELLSYVSISKIPLVPHRLAGGFLAYSMIFVMPYFQHLKETSRMTEARFTSLFLIYQYYVWFIFFMTYLSRVQGTFPNAGGTYTEHVALLGWVALMLGIKVSQAVSARMSRTP